MTPSPTTLEEVDKLFNKALNAKQVAVETAQQAEPFASNEELLETANALLERLRQEFRDSIAVLLTKHGLEERIDELGHVDGLPQCFKKVDGKIVKQPIDKRLGELRHQLKQLEK